MSGALFGLFRSGVTRARLIDTWQRSIVLVDFSSHGHLATTNLSRKMDAHSVASISAQWQRVRDHAQLRREIGNRAWQIRSKKDTRAAKNAKKSTHHLRYA